MKKDRVKRGWKEWAAGQAFEEGLADSGIPPGLIPWEKCATAHEVEEGSLSQPGEVDCRTIDVRVCRRQLCVRPIGRAL
jgi:hypothetical protein